ALHPARAGLLAELRLEAARRICGAAWRIGLALIEARAVGRIGEPVAAVGMRRDVVRRIEMPAVVRIGEDGNRAVVLVSHDAPGQMLAGDLASLEIERVAVAVVRRSAEDAHAIVVFEPAQLAVVRDVAPDEISPLAAPGGTFRP